MNKNEIAKMIDHTVLRADAQRKDIVSLCEEAKEYGFGAVCVNSCHAALAFSCVEGSGVKVGVTVGFPLGAASSKAKKEEAAEAVKNGAEEVDMVINVGALKDGDFSFVEADIKGVVDAVKTENPNAMVKVIFETCLLTKEEKEKACTIAEAAGADFVKTSTGFSTGGATKEDVSLLRQMVGNRLEVKASGGIRDYKAFMEMVESGADRIGTSNGIAILEGASE